MSQENEMCQRIFALAVGIYSTWEFRPLSVQLFFLRVLTPSASQSVSFPLNCLTANKKAPQEPPVTKNIQDQDQHLPGTAYKVITFTGLRAAVLNLLNAFRTVPYAVVNHNHKIISLLLHDCSELNVNICVFPWSYVNPTKGLFNPQRDGDPQVENHWLSDRERSRGTREGDAVWRQKRKRKDKRCFDSFLHCQLDGIWDYLRRYQRSLTK